MILKPVRIFGRKLQAVPELGPYEVNVGALSKTHVGKIVAISRRRATVTGRLDHVPMESVLHDQQRLGRTPMHPSEAVMVVPDTHKATVVIERKEDE